MDVLAVFEFARGTLLEVVGLGTVDIVDFGSSLKYAVCGRVFRVVLRVAAGIFVRPIVILTTSADGKVEGDDGGQGLRAIALGVYSMFGLRL